VVQLVDQEQLMLLPALAIRDVLVNADYALRCAGLVAMHNRLRADPPHPTVVRQNPELFPIWCAAV
jgi:hypothetical protein